MKMTELTKKGNNDKQQHETHECHYCHKKGHLKKDCWTFKRKQEAEKNANNDSEPKDGKMSVAFDPKQLDKLLAARHSNNSAPSTWFVDSGASNHVTGDKRHFTTYTPIQGQQLETANGKRLTVRGKGNVTIPGANGLMLADIWHAPGITSNLVSLGQLEDKGIAIMKRDHSIFLV